MAQTEESSIHPAPVDESAPGPAEPDPQAPPGGQAAPPMPVSQPEQGLMGRILALPRQLLALPAVGLAAYAERLVADARNLSVTAPPAESWWLFGLAAVLFAVAAWPVPALLPALPPPVAAAWRDPRRRIRFFLPLGLAILCALSATPLFVLINNTPAGETPPEPANTGAWLLWIAALLLFGTAWIA